MRTILLILWFLALLFTLHVSALAQEDYEYGVMPIFVFGEGGAWVGTGFVVGDGTYLVTTSDLVTESFSSAAKVTVKFPTVISPYTGDYYRAEFVAKDTDLDVAVLRLAEKGLPAARVAGPETFNRKPKPKIVAEKQLLSTEDVSVRWPTVTYGPARSEKNPLNVEIAEWRSEMVAFCVQRGVKWLYLSKISPEDGAPKGSPVVRRGEGIVGIYSAKFDITLIASGREIPLRFGRCLPSFEFAPFLTKSGVPEADIYQGAHPSGERDKTAADAFQRIYRAFSFIKSGNWKLAVEHAKALVELRPQSAKAHMLLGVALAGGGENEEALKTLDKAAELDPKLADLRFSRAEALFALQKDKEAEAAYRKAIEESPTEIRPVLRLAKLLSLDKERSAEAIALARKAVSMEPKSPGARMSLGLRFKEAGQYDAAIQSLNQALNLSPSWAGGHAALAETYRAAGKMAEAEQEYRIIVEDNPRNPAALFDLASFLADADKKDEARKTLADLEKLNPPKDMQEAIGKLKAKLGAE